MCVRWAGLIRGTYDVTKHARTTPHDIRDLSNFETKARLSDGLPQEFYAKFWDLLGLFCSKLQVIQCNEA